MPIIPSFLRPYVAYLESLAWIVWWVCLPLSKGAASVTIVTLWILGIVRFYDSGESLRNFLQQHQALLGIVALFFAYIVGLSYTHNINEGVNFTFRQNPFLLAPFIFAFYIDKVRVHIRQYFAWFIASNLFAGLVTIWLYQLPEAQAVAFTQQFGLLAYPQNNDMAASGLHSPFVARIQFVNLVALAAMAACWLLTSASTLFYRFIWAICLVLLLLISAYVGGRGAQIGLVAAMSVWLFAWAIATLYRPLARRMGKWVAMLGLGLGLLGLLSSVPYLAARYIPEVEKRYARMRWELATYQDGSFETYPNKGDFTSITRLISWQKAYEVLKLHPITGVGTGDYYDEVQKRLDADGIGFKVFAHQQFLQIWVMLGIGGLLLFVGAWAYWLRHIVQNSDFYTATLALSYTFFYTIVCCTDSALITQIGNTGFLLFWGGIYSCMPPKHHI
jgi:O-antigen ligase